MWNHGTRIPRDTGVSVVDDPERLLRRTVDYHLLPGANTAMIKMLKKAMDRTGV